MRLHLLVCGIATLAVLGCQKPAPPPPPPPPAAVQFVHPVEAAVTPYEEFGGRAISSETVELKARVTGYLKKVNFVDEVPGGVAVAEYAPGAHTRTYWNTVTVDALRFVGESFA